MRLRKQESWRRNKEARIAAGACRCGNLNCDCARWERIYREKFEDPTYYSEPRTRARTSALADLTPPDLSGLYEVRGR